jgi:hypothetical protein
MEKELQILKEKYGTWEAVAKKLQITYRHICHLRSGSRPAGKSLESLIKIYAKQIKELE